jgi:hypothetical protein
MIYILQCLTQTLSKRLLIVNQREYFSFYFMGMEKFTKN